MATFLTTSRNKILLKYENQYYIRHKKIIGGAGCLILYNIIYYNLTLYNNLISGMKL